MLNFIELFLLKEKCSNVKVLDKERMSRIGFPENPEITKVTFDIISFTTEHVLSYLFFPLSKYEKIRQYIVVTIFVKSGKRYTLPYIHSGDNKLAATEMSLIKAMFLYRKRQAEKKLATA